MKENLKIVAVEPIGISEAREKELKERFAKYNCSFSIFHDRKEDEETLVERIADNDIVIISNIPLKESVLSKCANVKLLAVAFTGIDHIDQNYCKERGIEIMNASGYATEAVSELAIGLMLDVLRQISFMNNSIRESGTRNNYLGTELKGKTVGIVGLGAIGKRTALLLRAFGANVLVYTRKKDNLVYTREGIRYVSIEELMKESDIISVHTPLTEETYHLINKELLSLCKPSAIIINTARGNVIDMQALSEALNNGKIAGAGIDVYEKEPPLEENHPLLNAKNCVCVPHIAYATKESFDARIDIVAHNIESWLQK
ncbi:MAG: hydroxyacid dehydrogenase [Bacteroidales bacterium]|nr:hydroxyacid dehydrogenase [Bacteroidales bacterium]